MIPILLLHPSGLCCTTCQHRRIIERGGRFTLLSSCEVFPARLTPPRLAHFCGDRAVPVSWVTPGWIGQGEDRSRIAGGSIYGGLCKVAVGPAGADCLDLEKAVQ